RQDVTNHRAHEDRVVANEYALGHVQSPSKSSSSSAATSSTSSTSAASGAPVAPADPCDWRRTAPRRGNVAPAAGAESTGDSTDSATDQTPSTAVTPSAACREPC